MAKELEKNDGQFEEEAQEMKPLPKKIKSNSTNEKQIPLVLMIGGALGGVIMIIVSVIIGTVIANKLFPPVQHIETEEVVNKEENQEQNNKLAPVPDDVDDFDEFNTLLADSDYLSFSLGKTQSNVKGSDMICILNAIFTYKPFYIEKLTEKGFLKAAGEDKHGNPTPGDADTTSTLFIKFKQNISSKMLDYITSHSKEELSNLQSSGVLADSLKTYFKKPFQETGLIIVKINITDFMLVKI